MSRAVAVFLAMLVIAPLAFAGQVNVEVNIAIPPASQRPLSRAYVTYATFFGGSGTELVRLDPHMIIPSGPSDATQQVTPFSNTIQSPTVAQPPNCYYAVAHAVADDSTHSRQSGQICYQGPAPDPGLEDPYATCEPSEYYACPPPGTWYYDDNGNLVCYGPCSTSPIVIGLDRGRYRLTDVDRGVRFDLNADGVCEATAWTAQGEALAFLALDRNQNGAIDSGRELFGDRTLLLDGTVAPHGFTALAEHDSNGDGAIDSSDRVWPALRLWIDSNHDGVSQPAELTPIDSSTVRRLGLDYRTIGGRDPHGNLFRYRGRVAFADGREQHYYDIFFVTN